MKINMKRTLGMIACFLLVVCTGAGARSDTAGGHFEAQSGGTYELGQLGSSRDAFESDVRAGIDKELLQAIREAEPEEVIVAHDGETGETWIIKIDTDAPAPKRTEPRIPEDVEVAAPPVLPHEIIGGTDAGA